MFIFAPMTRHAHDQVTPYENEAAKKEQVTNMFDKIAPFYDYLNRFLSLGIDVYWRKKAIGMLKDGANDRILDVATGTADLAIEAVQKLQPKELIGMDISANMIGVGNQKIKKKNLDHVMRLELGDSENLRYETEYFDTVTAAFGVRNFQNLEKGLTEMHRVLKGGGRMLILEFSKPRVFPIKNIFNAYFKYLLPVIGRIKSKDPKAYQYLYESVQAFPDYEDFSNVLKKVGFKKVTFKPLTFGICTIYLAEK